MSNLFDDLRGDSNESMRFDEEDREELSLGDFSSLDSFTDLDDDPRPQEEQPRARLKKKGKGFFRHDSRATVCPCALTTCFEYGV
ncbi:MAG: hypothetical protein HC806_08220 [Anaerolineae bacterium]|nr:hypothetical protein [Anaerolineae bacterium]